MNLTTNESGPVTAVVTWHIRPGREQAFEEWHHAISRAALEFPGHMGITLIRPAGQEQEHVVIFRFDTYQHLRAWQESNLRQELLKKAEPLQERAPSYQLENGLEYWFISPGARAAPPRWKMVMVTVLGVWPLSLLVPWLLHPILRYLSSPLKALLISVGIVLLLTWVVMPILVKMLTPWLHKTPSRRQDDAHT